MIVQSPNQRSQGGVIPAGLGKPSMGSRPPTPMGMPKPKPPVQPGKMKQSFSPMGGLTNPLGGAVNPVAKNFTGQPVQTMPAEVSGGSAVPVMQAEVERTGPMRPAQEMMPTPQPLESENDVGRQPFTADRNFRNRESWDSWRRGRSYLTGGAQL